MSQNLSLVALFVLLIIPIHSFQRRILCSTSRRPPTKRGIIRWSIETSASLPIPSFFPPYSCSSSTTTTTTTTTTKMSQVDEELLDRWIQHDTLEFHHFSREEAAQIRHALLSWYSKERRKLPWRGDPPPWEGSTIDFANKAKKKNQPKISDFFSAGSSRLEGNNNNNHGKRDEIAHVPTFPITPYGVWVSEIMLQQTRVEAVVPYWVRWMQSFPTVSHLAQATEEQVNAHFAGLGFYRRARLLHQACQELHETRAGVMPDNAEDLMKLPGVGRYTACAIASIAYGEKVAVVDGNVCRVLSRLCGIANQIKAPALKDKYGWELAQQLIEAGDGSRPGDVNQAIMELGATYCAPSGSGTDPNDPLVKFYRSTTLGFQYAIRQRDSVPYPEVNETRCPICATDGISQAMERMEEIQQSKSDLLVPKGVSFEDWARRSGHGALPLAPPKATRREEVLAVAVLTSRDGSFLMVKRPATGLLAKQWEFPAACVWTSESKVANGQVPNIALVSRRKDLNALLWDIFTDNANVKLVSKSAWQHGRKAHNETIEHIFSHIRHTVWIEEREIPSNDYNGMPRKWIDSRGREVRWMTENEMSEVGITSEVKKILKAIAAKKVHSVKRQRTK